MKKYVPKSIILAVFLCFPTLVCSKEKLQFDKATLNILQTSTKHKFMVELALTEPQQRYGLMFRRSLPVNHGMLFVYTQTQKITMWMKNTFVPLDMIFVDKNGIVNGIVQRTIPLSKVIISSPKQARAVLEVNAGTVSRLNIKVGDKIEHPIFNRGGDK